MKRLPTTPRGGGKGVQNDFLNSRVRPKLGLARGAVHRGIGLL